MKHGNTESRTFVNIGNMLLVNVAVLLLNKFKHFPKLSGPIKNT